jgi:hypothetical protein
MQYVVLKIILLGHPCNFTKDKKEVDRTKKTYHDLFSLKSMSLAQPSTA